MSFMINKLLFLLFILLSSFFIAFSQDVNKALEYFNSGQYEKAATEFENALPEIEKTYGANDTSFFSICLIYAAVSFDRSYQLDKAEIYNLKAKKVYELNNAINCTLYSVVLNNLAFLYQEKGKYENAELLYLQALQIKKEVLGVKHSDYAAALNNLATLYQNMGYYKKAEPLYLQAIQIDKESLGEYHPGYATDLNNLAEFYIAIGNYEKAEPLYLQALQITKKTLSEESPDYAISLTCLANLYQTLGKYEQAETLYLRALQIKKKVIGEDHPSYSTSLNNLALLYQSMGMYEKSESLYLKTLKIEKKILGEEHPDYATSLHNLASLYEFLGNYEKSESLYLQALQITKKAFGEEHPDYANSLNSLATLYTTLGNNRTDQLAGLNIALSYYEKAVPLYMQALQIWKKTLGEEHPDYAITLDNLAGIYTYLGNYEKAETLLLQAIQIKKKALGEGHPDYATSINNLAELYRTMGNYEKSEPLFLQALQIHKKVYGEEHSDYSISLTNLAILNILLKNDKKADSMVIKAFHIITTQIEKQFTFLSETEMANYLKTVLDNFKFYQSYFLQRKTISPALVGEAYNIEFMTKGMMLSSGIQMRQRIINCKDTGIINIYNYLTAMHLELAKQYSLPVIQRTLDTKEMEEKVNELEKELVRSSQIFANQQQFLKTSWEDLKNDIGNNEVAIEFSSFNFYDLKNWTKVSTYYVALVLRKNDEYPQMIYLCEEKQLDSVLNNTCGGDAQKTEQLYSARGVGINGATQSLHLASKLYDLIWRPIDSLLKDINTVYYSPSGLLHKISFAAIATPDSMCLLDKYKLVQLGRTAEIVGSEREDRYITVSDTAFLCGGINYDQMKTDKGIEDEKELFAYNRGPQISNDSTRSISWRYLPGTYKEARYIDSLFRKNKTSTVLYSDSNATETIFKNLSGKAPQVIHVSTHGFFFPEPKKEKPNDAFINMGEETYRFSENPLLRSGLIFAGANYVWKGGEQTPGQDDGILTAYEVSNMNLYNTKLVVLSACETGLGDIKGSEGVFGLQRAFKMAGVDYIIMSLWKVPDKETTEFMKLFYSNCLSNHSIRESFYLTQTTMRKKYNPYYWAAFVLME